MGKLPEAIQPRKRTLAQRRVEIQERLRRQRHELAVGESCVVVFRMLDTADDVRDGFVKEVVDDNLFIICAGREYVFDAKTHKCTIPIGKKADIFTNYEWQRMELFREDVLPRLFDLAQHGSNAGDMTLEEMKVLSACLEVAQKARDNKR